MQIIHQESFFSTLTVNVCTLGNSMITQSLPVTFLTVQKSIDSIITIITKLVTKLSMKKSHIKYKIMAAERKNIWKNTANGCLKKKNRNIKNKLRKRYAGICIYMCTCICPSFLAPRLISRSVHAGLNRKCWNWTFEYEAKHIFKTLFFIHFVIAVSHNVFNTHVIGCERHRIQ